MRGREFASKKLEELRVLAFGYAPERITASYWDHLFKSGAFDRLDHPLERARYSIIVGHQDLIQSQTILDVGCGQGVLAKRLARTAYQRYHGFDLSDAAVRMARETNASKGRNTFSVCSAADFQSKETYDWIIFNECLYYLDAPFDTIMRYSRLLSPEGYISISMYNTIRSRAIWKSLRSLSTIEAVELRKKGVATWTIKLMRLMR